MKICTKILKILIITTLAFITFGLNASPKIIISNYPWKKTSFAQMLEDTKASDAEGLFIFQGMKIGGDGPNADVGFNSRMSDEALTELQAMLDKYNKKIKGIGHIKLTKPDQIEAMFKFCKKVGIEVMTIEAPVEVLGIYDEMAIKYGVDGGLYNHPKAPAPYIHPEQSLAAIKGLKKIKIFPDLGQWGRARIDAMESYAKITPENIIAVSLQDLSEKKANVEFGKGVLPVKEFVSKLNATGFNGYYIIMFASLPQAPEVVPSADYVRNIK